MCQTCDWEEELDRISGLVEDGRYDFALETLEGILRWVEDQEHVTQKQRMAIDNIEMSVHE